MRFGAKMLTPGTSQRQVCTVKPHSSAEQSNLRDSATRPLHLPPFFGTFVDMKKTILIAAALLACIVCGAETIKGSDSRISYIGRTEVQEDGSVSFDWSATTFRFSFKGKTLTMVSEAASVL